MSRPSDEENAVQHAGHSATARSEPDPLTATVDSPPPEAVSAAHRIRNAVTYLLSRTVTRLNAQVAKRLRDEHNMSIAQWRVLAILADEQDITSAAIRRIVDIDKGQLSRLVSAMQVCGWVEVAEDPLDLRRQRISLTDEGRRAHAGAEPMMGRRRQRLESQITAEEKATLIAILEKINAAAETELSDD
ncbi:MAG: MarR family winged helix-turn-helix transcriptional regulator [Pseudomonadota bacterium]